ncbi:MAG: XdhC family protein [Acidimicrobiales bacterium]
MPASADRDVVAELAARLERGEEVLLATAVRTDGAPPCQPGQKLLLSAKGPVAGTLGCSELDAQAEALAGEVLAGGAPAVRILDHDLGKVEAYMEPYPARPLLVVLGATPVAEWLLRWAPNLGYETSLVDPRPDRITPELRSLTRSVQGSPAALRALAPGASVARVVDAVHTDHDAPDIAAHLATLLTGRARFVGVMGSARHVSGHLDDLRRQGFSESDIARVRSPVGLNIGALTPAEIALSILAGLVAARQDRDGGWLDEGRAGGHESRATSAG